MSNKPVLLVDLPKIWEEAGIFYVDFEIEKFPVLAYKPSDLVDAVRVAHDAYMRWLAKGCGTVLELPDL